MNLQVNDVVVLKGDDKEFIEKVEKYHNGLFETQGFTIQDDYTARFRTASAELFSLTEIWRSDENDGNYVRIYPEPAKTSARETNARETNARETNARETYIDFTVAPYALVDVLLALDNNGIKDFAITKEDNDLHIRIPKTCQKHRGCERK